MALLDYSKNCDIFNNSFVEDLLDYRLDHNNTIVWSDNTQSVYKIKPGRIQPFILLDDDDFNETIFDDVNDSNLWEPIFFANDNDIKNKIISSYGSILNSNSNLISGRLGREDFITFNPKFKNWDFTNAEMTIDWILNRSNTPYYITYGLAYWCKNANPIKGTIDEFPLYSKLKYKNNIYLKIDNTTIRKINEPSVQQAIFTNDNSISFQYTGNNSDISVSLLDPDHPDPIFTLFDTDNASIWVADGDQVLYYLNEGEKNRNLIDRIGPRSYISGSLYKYYTNIYNALTSKENLTFGSRSLKKLRLYKKLAHSLSCSPFISDFFLSFLVTPPPSVQSALDEYINSESDSISTDIANLKIILSVISQEFDQYEVSGNVLKNTNDLFLKLINKYGAKLKFIGNTNANIIFKKPLLYGDSVIIEEIGDISTTKDAKDRDIVINKKINLSKLSLETNLSATEASIFLKIDNQTKNVVYLYDHVKPDVVSFFQPEGFVGGIRFSNINISLQKNNNLANQFIDPDNPLPGSDNEYDPNNIVFYWGTGPIENNINNWNLYCPKLRAVNFVLETKYTDSRFPNQANNLINSQFSYVWEKISGPPLKFLDDTRSSMNKSYDRAYSNDVIIVPSSTGKYVIKCTVTSPFGSYTKTKTLFIVDGRQKIGNNNNNFFNTYSDGKILDNIFQGSSDLEADAENIFLNRLTINDKELNRYSSENTAIFLNRDKLRVFSAGLGSIAIHRNGLFVPIRTDHYVEKILSDDRPIEKLENNNYKFLFDENNTIEPVTQNSFLRIGYDTNPVTNIKLERIILRNIRNETVECSQCYSLYNPKFRSYQSGPLGNKRTIFRRSNKDPDDFSLQRYVYDPVTKAFERYNVVTLNYKYPKISTDIAPPIKTYGGYGYKVLNQLSIKKIDTLDPPDNLDPNQGYVANQAKILSPVTGHKLNYRDDQITFDDAVRDYKFCYQKNVMPEGYIEFDKGCFVPSSGWVIGDNRNLTSVLKFNPGARKSYSFAGPGILNLSNYSPDNTIDPNIFSSSIELTINPYIRWDPGPAIAGDRCLPDDEESKRNEQARAKGIHFFQNQLDKELSDQYIGGSNDYHHGYRILNGGLPKVSELYATTNSPPQNDEFNIDIDEENNRFIYNFNVVGPNNPINLSEQDKEFIDLFANQNIQPGSDGDARKVRDYIEQKSSFGLRDPRINNLKIKDIEIQLNFLNYVNTKNLIIWLDVEFSSSDKEKMRIKCNNGGCTAPPQITSENVFVDQFISNNVYKAFGGNIRNSFDISDNIDVKNTNINNMLKQLTDLNSLDTAGEKLRLYLLNQETIQNKEYNFSVKFSDSASKNNVLFDHNLFTQGAVNGEQNIISNNNDIRPTTSILGEDTKYNASYSNLIKFHNLNINNNTFNKFANKSLFVGVHPRARCQPLYGPYDSSTKFTLNIAVLDEEDDMLPLDTTVNNEIHTNLASVENKISPANFFNNLCSWELILHTDDTKKPITSQVNSLANYGGTDSLSLIEYGEQPKYPGYNFIANLSDRKFLLPLVNMNAPTTFFQNYNACEYADSELIGRGTLVNTPRFPFEAIIFILAGTAVGGMTGTLVGALVGGLGPTYALGFQVLYDYFREARAVPLLQEAQQETFDIDYDAYPFGNSDKILINASKDGCFWYKVEASIFKYSNTPALPLKKYKFLKENDKLLKFDFSIVKKNSDIIDELFIPNIIDQATPIGAEDDVTSRYKNIDDEVYDSFNFIDNNVFITFNKLINNENNIFDSKIYGDSLIIIDNNIAYNLFSIGDDVFFNDDKDTIANITSKALVYKDGSYQTILGFNNIDLSGYDQINVPTNVIVVYNDNSTYTNKQELPVSDYGLINIQPPYNNVPDKMFSTNSIGSYGDGAIIKDKNILSRKVKINHIDHLCKMFNSFECDKLYRNKIYTNDTEISEYFSAYPVYYDENRNSIINNVQQHLSEIDANNEELNRILFNIEQSTTKNNNIYYKDNKYNIMYIKIQSNKFDGFSDSGELSIENSYTYNDIIQNITEVELSLLSDRLDVLNISNNNELDLIIGTPNRTNQVLISDSIFYIQLHYDALEDTDTLNKRKTFNKLQKLYNERIEILKVLESQAIAKAKIFKTENNVVDGEIEFESNFDIKLKNNETTFIKEDLHSIKYYYVLNSISSDVIIPDQKIIINSNTDSSLNIDYVNNSEDYYWINIDPKQSCSIAEELRPRVLKSARYECLSTNPVFSAVGAGVRILDYNNICPDPLGFAGSTGPRVDFEFDSSSSPNDVKYTFKEDIITSRKQDLENKYQGCIFGWKEQIIERKFRIHADESIKKVLDNTEYLVTVTEVYDVAMTQLEAAEKNWAEAGLDREEIIELAIEEGLLKNDYSHDLLQQGLLNGAGGSSRSSKPTRVYNIFNLDEIDRLKVQFRKAPRMVRGIDFVGTVLRYGENITYRPQRGVIAPTDMFNSRSESLINNFYYWECFQKSPVTGQILPAKTPEFFQLMNEMIFRAFFGSVDNIEHKTEKLKSLYDWESIPFEYFTKLPPKPQQQPPIIGDDAVAIF